MHAIPYHVWLATADPSGSILLGVLHCIIWPHLHVLALVKFLFGATQLYQPFLVVLTKS